MHKSIDECVSIGEEVEVQLKGDRNEFSYPTKKWTFRLVKAEFHENNFLFTRFMCVLLSVGSLRETTSAQW